VALPSAHRLMLDWPAQPIAPRSRRFHTAVRVRLHIARAHTYSHAHNCTQLNVCVCVCVRVCAGARARVCVCVCVCVSQPAQVYLATQLLQAGGGLGAEMVEGEDAVAAVRDLERGSWQSAADGASVSSAMPPLQVPTPRDARFNPRVGLRGRVSAGGSDFTFMWQVYMPVPRRSSFEVRPSVCLVSLSV
jgi:hypothetical protein